MMAKVTLELDEDLQKRLSDSARREDKTAEEIVLEALLRYLSPREEPVDPPRNLYRPLLRMVGLAEEGPVDSSVRHDSRETDPS